MPDSPSMLPQHLRQGMESKCDPEPSETQPELPLCRVKHSIKHLWKGYSILKLLFCCCLYHLSRSESKKDLLRGVASVHLIQLTPDAVDALVLFARLGAPF